MSPPLRYPLNLLGNKNDYIKLSHFPYRSNIESKRQGGMPSAHGRVVKLYMPNSTPATHYSHDTKIETFPGPLGASVRGALSVAGSADFKSFGEKLKDAFTMENLTNTGGGALYQVALDKVAGFFGKDAATAIAIGSGRAFNPNAEMVYNQPHHRKFDFAFDFFPKSREEAHEVDEIIKEFKVYSAAAHDEGANFIKIPDLWVASYHVGGGEGKFRRMNLFKPAMMTNLIVQDNPSASYHMTIDDSDPTPVHTAINFTLEEVQPVMQHDHQQSEGIRGF